MRGMSRRGRVRHRPSSLSLAKLARTAVRAVLGGGQAQPIGIADQQLDVWRILTTQAQPITASQRSQRSAPAGGRMRAAIAAGSVHAFLVCSSSAFALGSTYGSAGAGGGGRKGVIAHEELTEDPLSLAHAAGPGM